MTQPTMQSTMQPKMRKTSAQSITNPRYLVYAGVFTALYFVITFGSGMLGIISPLMIIVGALIGVVCNGVVVMLYIAKTPYFGALTITGTIVGFLMMATGHTWYVSILGLAMGFLADLIANSGHYRRRITNCLAYAVLNLWSIAPIAPIFYNSDAYFAHVQDSMSHHLLYCRQYRHDHAEKALPASRRRLMNHVPSRVPAHRLTGRSGLDPRTKLLTITVCNMLAMGAFPSKVLWIIVALATLLLLIDASLRAVATYATGIAIAAVLYTAPLLPHNSVTGWIIATSALVGYWLARIGTCIALAYWMITSTTVSELITAFRQLHAPRAFIIPLAVVFRFIPVAFQEFRGVLEALALRGFSGSALWLHPVRTAEKLIVPVLSASARIADDLAAAALIRGLGAPGTPTSVVRLRFSLVDALTIAVVAAITVYAFWGGALL